MEKARLRNNIPVAYAVSYLVGTTAIVWFLPMIGPKLMRVDLREEARKLQAQVLGTADDESAVTSASRVFNVRAYRITNPDLLNRTVA